MQPYFIMTEDEHISPCHFFQAMSWYVWKRIAFSRKMNLRVSETTITENLLFQFYEAFEQLRLPVRLFESIEENRNGSDLEVLLKTDKGYILLTCQAKIAYKAGNYRAFHHMVGGARQIDLLQEYAKKHGGIAQYLFYNYIPDDMLGWEPGTMKSIENHGITNLEAEEIQHWMAGYERLGKKPPTPHFNTFHPMAALPFHELICQLLGNERAYLRAFPEETLKTLTFYDEKEVRDADTWRQITSLATIGYVDQKYAHMDDISIGSTSDHPIKESAKQAKPQKPPIFKPKFRLVIGEGYAGAIYHIE